MYDIKDLCDPKNVPEEESQTEEKNDVEHKWHLSIYKMVSPSDVNLGL